MYPSMIGIRQDAMKNEERLLLQLTQAAHTDADGAPQSDKLTR